MSRREFTSQTCQVGDPCPACQVRRHHLWTWYLWTWFAFRMVEYLSKKVPFRGGGNENLIDSILVCLQCQPGYRGCLEQRCPSAEQGATLGNMQMRARMLDMGVTISCTYGRANILAPTSPN